MKKSFPICFLLFLCLFISGNVTGKSDTIPRKKIALVLSGGGAKGFAHIGVLKVLEEEGIPIDIIVGTSIGSLIGGIYSMGYTADEIEKMVNKINWPIMISDDVSRLDLPIKDKSLKQRYLISLPLNEKKIISLPMGVIKGQNAFNLLCGLCGNVPENTNFTKLPVSFACVAANLETGKEVVMKNGFLPSAIFSSLAIPGVFEPSQRDSMLLVDGGIVNNFPTDIAKKMGADIIIGVDIQSDLYTRKEINSMSEIMGQMVNFLGMEKNSTNGNLCDIIIRPDITGYSTSSFTIEAADTLIARGEEATNSVKGQLEELKTRYHLSPKKISREFVAPEKWKITGIDLKGYTKINGDFIKKKMKLNLPGEYSYDEIKKAIDRIYGYGGFNKIYFTLPQDYDNKGRTLTLNITKEKKYTQNIGFKVNTTDAAALLLNVTHKNYANIFGYFSASAELSANPGISLTAESTKDDLPCFGISLKGKHQNYSIHENGDKTIDADLYYASGDLYLYQSFLTKYNAGFGIKEEYFNGDVFSRGDNSQSLQPGKIKTFNTNLYLYFSLDNIDNFYFPTKGTSLYSEMNFDTNLKLENISPSLLIRLRNVIPISGKSVLLLNFYSRSQFDTNYPEAKTTLIGGDCYSKYFSYHLPYIGASPVVMTDRFTTIEVIGLREKVAKTKYISLLFNALQEDGSIIPNKNSSYSWGGGIKLSMETLFGPIEMGLGYSNLSNGLTFSANLGLWF